MMEIDGESESHDNNVITVADSVWKFINSPIIAIFSDLENSATEQMLCSLLESLLKRSSTLTNVLIPPFNNGPADEALQRQYAAFTTWLFGTMFYMVCTPPSNTVLSNSIEVQACMLRILSRHHLTMFETISSEYLNIIEETLEFYVNTTEVEEMTISKFYTEKDIIPNLDLTPFPAKIKASSASLVQIPLLKIITKAGVLAWNQEKLWNITIATVVKSCPDVKIEALQLCAEIIENSSIHDREFMVIITHSLEVVKSLPSWINSNRLSPCLLSQFAETMTRLIQLLPISHNVAELCFQVIDLAASEFSTYRGIIETINKLMEATCYKIRQYLIREPRSCSISEAKKFLAYFEHYPAIVDIFMQFVFIDIGRVALSEAIVLATEISEPWKLLRRKLMSLAQSEKFTQVSRILKASSLLQSWLEKQKIQVNLYENDLNVILRLFVQKLNSDEIREETRRTIFRTLMYLMVHSESNRVLLQSILALPFTQDFKGTMDIGEKVVQNAKSLDVETRSKCLEAVCAYGAGKQRLKLLHVCVLNNETEIAVAAVSNSVLLLNDADVKIEDVNHYILSTALSSTKPEVQEALASVLSQMACVLAGTGRIVSEPSKNRKWTIHCEYCTGGNMKENAESNVHRSLSVHDHIFSTYFKLLSSSNVSIRLNMSRNMISLSNHVKSFNSNDVTKKWLTYVYDSNAEIRLNVASAIGRLLSNKISMMEYDNKSLLDTVPGDLDEYVDLVVDVIANTLVTALDNSNHSLHDTLLVAAKNFICVPLYLSERRILNVFLLTILHPNSSPAAVASATVAYQDVADFLNVSPKVLYIRYRKDFLKLIMERAVYNYIEFSYNIATTVHRVAKCIGYEGSRQLLRKDGHYAICYLIAFVVEVPKANVLLYDIAELISMDIKQMLEEYFPYICSYAFLELSSPNSTECLKLTTRITKSSLALLTRQSFMGIFEELMLNFYDSPAKITSFLEIISEYDSNQRGKFDTQEQIASYLNLRLHGILVNFDIKLGPKSDEHTQQSALASLTVLIRYMGAPYITPLRYKILATLRTALGFKRPGFPRLVCDAWDAFIHNIAIEDLGSLFPTICVSLIPLQNMFPEKVNSILEFLIVQNSGEHISELFFIDDIKVPDHISAIVKAHILQARPEGFNANLKLWLKRITHETGEVRIRALKHLQAFLEKHRSELNRMILSETDVHPLIVELLDTLLIGCQDKDESIRLCYGECLGELGAIEPSLLPRRIISREDSKFIPDVSEEFACALLFEHVRAFQMQKDSQSMDCFSLAIQEILRAYEISPEGRNNALWSNLPLTTQQIITPFLTSHYKIVAVRDDNEFPHPIYGSEAGSSVESWAYNWLCSMFSAVRDATLSNVLQACKFAFKRDIKTLIFCLPYIVSYVIANNREEEHAKLREEMLAVINVREKPVLDAELLRHQPLRYGQSVKADDNRISEETRRTRCSRVVFCILDHLQRWLREQRLSQDEKYRAIKKFCATLDSLIVSQGCYYTREYHRALMYLEEHMASSNKGLSKSTEDGLLAKIYAQLDEPDGVSGILVSQDQSPTLQQLVLAHEVNGQLQDAATCYERLAQKRDLKHTYLQGMIQCYLGLDQPFTAMHITEGLLSSRPELEPLITEREVFWRLAHFSRFEETSQRNINHALLDDLTKGIKPDLLSLKKNLVLLLEDASRPGAYQQSYSYIMKLHILNEFDKAASLMLNNIDGFPLLLEEWDKRGQLLRTSRGVEFVLSMRRAALDLAVQLQQNIHNNTENSVLRQEIGKIWLKSAKIARKAGLHQQAYMHILSASDSCPPQPLYIEQAQLYWQKDSQEDAFTTLNRCFSNYFQPAQYYKQLPSGECNEERKQYAKAKLLFAKYNDETINVDTDGCIANYKEAIEVWRGWEKSWVACADYYDTIIERLSEDDKDRNKQDLQVHIMNFYGKSLLFGCKYIHHSMPKMLTVWLDVASRASVTSDPPDVVRLRQDRLSKMTQIMEAYYHKLPVFMWLAAFSQLVSRICHPSSQVQTILCTILVKLISVYPQHCLWMMASVFNSSYPARLRRCQEILNHAQLKTPDMSKLIKDFYRLWEKLIELSNKVVSDQRLINTTVTHLCRYLPKLLASKDFSQIMMPTKRFRQLHLPPKNASMENHNPFLIKWVHITKIEEDVVVMPSLQRPRRIAFRGSDGKEYLFMCKPKDDLRKDFRLMEFNDIVNKYLQNDPESRQRRLYIRTYSVVPLNEECGLIEWVPNLVGLRPTILNLYKERNTLPSNRELKLLICQLKDPLEKKRKIFLEELLPRHPPIFADWFRIMFPDPYGWYEARTAYIRTTAVMSMVGYILGLGDRHGENILFDSKCGDCVHVDFNCLFNRGELFDWPERVPFRLTHNMIDAMGPLKVEGPFRRACQITMRVLRQESSTLLSVLKPFVYDPLVSWNRNQNGDAAEKTNEKAVENIKNIEQRLKGLIRYPGRKAENIALHLSVEGQTNYLILEATNIDNLCQMYHGWGAFM